MVDSQSPAPSDTTDYEYSERLLREEVVWWKRLLDVQLPYRWNLRRLNLGFTLDLGCGLGRNLRNLNGNGVGIDHNPRSVEIARSRGLRAFTPEEFLESEFNRLESFDSILLSHVAEHMLENDVVVLLGDHTPLLKRRGLVVLITPQECGYRSDPTHVQFMDFASLRRITSETGLLFVREFSFPFPRVIGRVFRYNEFVCVCRKS